MTTTDKHPLRTVPVPPRVPKDAKVTRRRRVKKPSGELLSINERVLRRLEEKHGEVEEDG